MSGKNVRPLLMVAILLIGMSLACNAPARNATADLSAIVAQTQTALALEQTLTAISTLVPTTATPTSLPPSAPTASAEAPIPATTESTPPPSPSATAPAATNPPNCTNQAYFEGETIPDDSVFQPNTTFEKTWTLRNIGTCTWTPDYSLVFVSGHQLGAANSLPIGVTVPPNGIFVARVTMMAPPAAGSYQGFWKLRTPAGQEFGLGKNADVAFWVKITVSGEETTFRQGEPDWIDHFDGPKASFYLGDDNDIGYALKDGRLVMTAFRPAGDQWRVAQAGSLADFYLEAQFQTGDACSGRDGYGLIFRAPDQPNNIINSGYVAVISCEGRFRLYRMDLGTFVGLQNFTAHSAIKAGPKQSNTLGILAVQDRIQIFINGVQVLEIRDATYSQGLFGLVIRSENTPNLAVFVEQIAYWLP